MSGPICFMAGESAQRSSRYVVPFRPPGTRTIFHELIGTTTTSSEDSWRDEVEALSRRAGLVLPAAQRDRGGLLRTA